MDGTGLATASSGGGGGCVGFKTGGHGGSRAGVLRCFPQKVAEKAGVVRLEGPTSAFAPRSMSVGGTTGFAWVDWRTGMSALPSLFAPAMRIPLLYSGDAAALGRILRSAEKPVRELLMWLGAEGKFRSG